MISSHSWLHRVQRFCFLVHARYDSGCIFGAGVKENPMHAPEPVTRSWISELGVRVATAPTVLGNEEPDEDVTRATCVRHSSDLKRPGTRPQGLRQ